MNSDCALIGNKLSEMNRDKNVKRVENWKFSAI